MTKAQTDMQLVQLGARYITTKDGIEWWRLNDGSWVGRRQVGQNYELRRFPASACNC